MASLPSEGEIFAVAQELGLLVDGKVPPTQRARLAQVALDMRTVDQPPAPDPNNPVSTTVTETPAGRLVVKVWLKPHTQGETADE